MGHAGICVYGKKNSFVVSLRGESGYVRYEEWEGACWSLERGRDRRGHAAHTLAMHLKHARHPGFCLVAVKKVTTKKKSGQDEGGRPTQGGRKKMGTYIQNSVRHEHLGGGERIGKPAGGAQRQAIGQESLKEVGHVREKEKTTGRRRKWIRWGGEKLHGGDGSLDYAAGKKKSPPNTLGETFLCCRAAGETAGD